MKTALQQLIEWMQSPQSNTGEMSPIDKAKELLSVEKQIIEDAVRNSIVDDRKMLRESGVFNTSQLPIPNTGEEYYESKFN